MSWIETIDYQNADKKLKKLYDRINGPGNSIDNILLVHSLRPHTLTGHMTLYKNVLHNSANDLPKWFLETIGVYVSILNQCDYCIRHHFAGLKRLLSDDARAGAIYKALEKKNPGEIFKGKFLAALEYTGKLTKSPQDVDHNDFLNLKNVGLDDGVILEINQVASYFNYANRTASGLGVNISGDLLGLSPGDNSDPSNWSHH